MRVFVAVNQVSEIGFRQTTAMLIASLAQSGCEVHLADVEAFSFHGGADKNRYIARTVALNRNRSWDSSHLAAFANSGELATANEIQRGDLILIRTNPGRDQHRSAIHDTFLDICRAAQAMGIRVVNNPANLRFFASKGSLALVDPEFRPVMLVSHDAGEVAEFVRTANTDCVVKPLVGSRGQDVIRVRPNQDDLGNLLQTTFGDRGVIVQHFVHFEEPGDKRVVVVGGEILESGDWIAGIARRPAENEFRANLHAGGTAAPLILSDRARSAAIHAAQILHLHGIWLAGVDLIGDQIIEFNVFSTGGLYDAVRFSGFDFPEQIVSRLLALD